MALRKDVGLIKIQGRLCLLCGRFITAYTNVSRVRHRVGLYNLTKNIRSGDVKGQNYYAWRLFD